MAGRVFRFVSLLIITTILVSACGSGSSPGDTTAGIQADSTSADLQELLIRELAALGKTVSDTETGLALGPDNIVFDLAVTPINNSVNLQWTERIAGDYNQDGLVSAEDLTPLGQFFGQTVEYEPASEHGGFSRWPAGDPADGGAGALNWRKARIDGDGNGLIGIGDITMLAQHWQERGGGYAVYRRAEGETDYTRIVRVFNPRPNAPQPVVCKFQDNHWVAGVFEYYVAPYSPALDNAGAASVLVTVDLAAGTWERHPVAVLKTSTKLAGAPAVVSFNASQSYDSASRELELHWDFEGDGVVDYTSGDPEPGPDWASSSGTVTDLVITGENLLNVTYRRGSAEWYWPEITAVNADGLSSLPATTRLGISGWEHESMVVYSGDHIYYTKLFARDLSFDSLEKQITIVGPPISSGYIEDPLSDGLYLSRRSASQTWVPELVTEKGNPAFAELLAQYPGFSFSDSFIFWQSNGLPGVFFTTNVSGRGDGRLFAAEKQADGSWNTNLIWMGSMEWKWPRRGIEIVRFNACGPGEFSAIITDEEFIGDTYNRLSRVYVVVYNNGIFSVEDTGEVSSAYDQPLSWITYDADAMPTCLGYKKRTTDKQQQIWGLRRSSPGVWEDIHILDYSLPAVVGDQYFSALTYDKANRASIIGRFTLAAGSEERWDCVFQDGGQTIQLSENALWTPEICVFRTLQDGSLLGIYQNSPGAGNGVNLVSTLIKGNRITNETVVDMSSTGLNGSVDFIGFAEDIDGACHLCFMRSSISLASRVDPSLN